ncbi:hypothetical protein [Adlercreutzia sp. ZJ473]|uniref:hypothetical protein n=1 Tax=Adlercreutzia sp. ZJ473 TaxID=2722822 RepID=UPI0015518FAB|nr:hypothetical protein [Adlercreutzia sp. ZJ473]
MTEDKANFMFFIDRAARDEAKDLFGYLGFGINAAVAMLMSRIAHGRTVPLDFSLYVDPAIAYSRDKVKVTVCLDRYVRDEATKVIRDLSLGNTELMEHFINECLVKQAIPFAVRK